MASNAPSTWASEIIPTGAASQSLSNSLVSSATSVGPSGRFPTRAKSPLSTLHNCGQHASQRQIDALPRWQESDAFNVAERAVLAYTDSMTKDIHVPDSVFDALRPHFDTRELTELTATIGAYNLVSRFIEAVKIDQET